MKNDFRKHSIKMAVVIVAAIALVAGLTVNSHAASAGANATATVITPIAISNTADLAFGNFAASTGGTVVIDAAGSRTKTGAVVLSAANAGAAASFDVTGQADATYAISLPSSATITSGANNMTVDTFTSSPSATGTLSAGGAQTVSVGATLTVASAQATGDYTGTFSVSVEYN